MLSRSDIAMIEKMRKRLTEIESKLEHKEENFALGRLAEACRAADDALMQILIVASTRSLGVTVEELLGGGAG